MNTSHGVKGMVIGEGDYQNWRINMTGKRKGNVAVKRKVIERDGCEGDERLWWRSVVAGKAGTGNGRLAYERVFIASHQIP